MDMLAAPLHGSERERFLSDAEADLNKSLPAPGRQQMKNALRIVR